MARTVRKEFTGDRAVFFDSSVKNAKMKSKRYNKGLRQSRKTEPLLYVGEQRKKIAESLWEL